MAAQQPPCQVSGCGQQVLAAFSQERLCMAHYIVQATERLQAALELCQKGRALDRRLLDWLLSDGDFAIQSLARGEEAYPAAQRAQLLEMLLALSNLQEYLRHHSVDIKEPD